MKLGIVSTSKVGLEDLNNSYSHVCNFHLSLLTNLASCRFDDLEDFPGLKLGIDLGI